MVMVLKTPESPEGLSADQYLGTRRGNERKVAAGAFL